MGPNFRAVCPGGEGRKRRRCAGQNAETARSYPRGAGQTENIQSHRRRHKARRFCLSAACATKTAPGDTLPVLRFDGRTYIHLYTVMLSSTCGLAASIGTKATRRSAQSHGVSLAEIEALFAHNPRIAPDPKHSAAEDRLIAAGRTTTGRPLFVAFTIRMKDNRRLIRPMTARYMHAKEIRAYEKEESSTP